MYKIECQKEFEMPLQVLPFNERYQILTSKGKKKKIVYIKNEFDNSTFRYRCYNFRESLLNSNKFEITYFLCDEINTILRNIKNIDLIVFQRAKWTIEIENLIYMARLNKIPIAYDMDDLLYKIDYVPAFMNHVGVGYTDETIPLYFSIAATYEMVARKCDYFITTTPALKTHLEKDFNKPTFVIPNYLNYEQITESNDIVKNREFDDSKFVIGYFSGSPSHKHDFYVAINDITLLLEKYDNIYLKIVGFMELDGKLKDLQKKGRIIFQELVPYQQLQYEIGSVDVNIIPLVNIEFNECKSELKYFEAGILKVPSCISKTKLYESFVEDHVNGIFCEEGKWANAIEELYLNPQLRKKIGEAAYKTSQKLYLPQLQKEKIETVYQEILK